MGLITIVGWLAWLVFALSVISELLAIVSRQRIQIHLPGLDVAAALRGRLVDFGGHHDLGAAVRAGRCAFRSPDRRHSRDGGTVRADHGTGRSATTQQTAAAPRTARVDHTGHQHVVKAGDDLWSLAERYYGDGRDWRKIAAANPKVLTGGPDRLQVGWRLKIPDLDEGIPEAGRRIVTVRRGDSLSSIAERELGARARWKEIFHVNRAQLSDPDEIAVGMKLVIPKPKKSTATATSRARDHQHRRPDAPDQKDRDSAAPTESSASPRQPAPESSVTSGQPSGLPSLSSDGSHQAPTTTVPTVEVSPLSLAGAGALLAAGVIGGLAWRRRVQLQTRPQGRRIVHPPPPTREVEVVLGQRQRPMSLRTLDRAMRAIAAHCKEADVAPPPLQLALVGDGAIELRMQQPCSYAPVGFTVRGRSWFVEPADVEYLKSVPGLSEAARPWPALVTLGRDEHERLVLGDLEAFGMLQLGSDSGFPVADLVAAMAVELSFSPWADEMMITLVGGGGRLPAALGKHNVSRTDDPDTLIDRLEQRAAQQREHRRYQVLSQHRVDPELADPWAPEIVLAEQPLTMAQSARLSALVNAEPKVALAAVVVGPVPGAAWSLGEDRSSPTSDGSY